MITIGFRQVIYNAGEADGFVTLLIGIRSGSIGVLDDDVNVRLYIGDDTARGMDSPLCGYVRAIAACKWVEWLWL